MATTPWESQEGCPGFPARHSVMSNPCYFHNCDKDSNYRYER